mgnify:CR=1 FL=1
MTFLCAVPFLYTEVNLGIIDALFESMSGVTTTGATTLTNLESLPKGILIWRAFLQWLGGIGIVVIALFILPFLRIGGMQLFRMESSDPSEKALPRAAEIASSISLIYLGMTFFCAIAYWFAGMSGFDSIAHSMTTIATGGYSTIDLSLIHISEPTRPY